MANQYVWTSPDGASIDLSDRSAGYIVTDAGTTGLRSPAYTVTAANYAGIDGSTMQSIRAAPGEPTLGLFIEAPDFAAFRTKLRGLVHAMRPKWGPGTLTVTNETGESRTLTCYCTGGLEGDEQGRFGPWMKAVLKFYAPDPWWYGPAQTFTFGLGAPTLFFPIPPVTLSPGSVQGVFTIDLSDSDDPTYPVWTITGPGSALLLANQTTGRSIEINASLAAGETMTIDTRPGFQSVRRGDGTNLMSTLASDPAMWPLIEDVNQVSASLTGATSASRIRGVYQPRFAGI